MIVAEDFMVNFYGPSRCGREFQLLVAAHNEAFAFTKRIWFTLTPLLIIGLIADIYKFFIFHTELI
jgi:hypothetical protein